MNIDPGINRRHLFNLGGAVVAGSALSGLIGSAPAQAAPPGRAVVSSPSGSLRAELRLDAGAVSWRVLRDGMEVLRPSALGLQLSDGASLGNSVELVREEQQRRRGTWTPVGWTQEHLREDHEEVTWTLREQDGAMFAVVLRAYDEGVAVRYQLLRTASGGSSTRIAREVTEFRFRPGVTVWANRSESETLPQSPGDIAASGGRDSGRLTDQPLTATFAEGDAACVTESAVEHYPRMMLESVPGDRDALVVRLARHAQQGDDAAEETSFPVDLPFSTPWRVLAVAATQAGLLDASTLPLTLGNPSVIGDTSWIRPGSLIRDVTLSTSGGKACVDFAVARGLSYVLYDAGWYGPEGDPTSDATTVTPDPARVGGIPGWDGLDLQAVIDYGRSLGVGILLYVNKRALDRQLDDILPLYEQWGAAGIKMGFIAQGRQVDNDWIYNAVRKAGAHHLVVDTHDDVRPMGLGRTLPNWLTQEGVRGNEHMPTARNNLTLPFTRNVGGPMDATFCFDQARMLTTDAHNLAAAVVFVSPLTSLYWYGKPDDFTNADATRAWQDLPTTWDESRTIAGRVGEYAVVARRRGAEWFIAAITNEQAREVPVDLGFLGRGTWRGVSYQDAQITAAPADTPVAIEETSYDRHDRAVLRPGPSGGALLRLRPRETS